MPGKGKHSKKWDDCVQKVKDKGGDVDPYAVCTASLGHQAALPFQQVFSDRMKKKKEAISASSNAALTRGKKK